jgi:transcriptional antiterminator NusG
MKEVLYFMGEEEKKWYAVHTYSGYENRVKTNLEQRIKSMNVDSEIFQVIVPTEKEIEIRGGQRYNVERKLVPGYIFIQMKLTDETWRVVRNTPGVAGFVGLAGEPLPIEDKEAEAMLKRASKEISQLKVDFKKGEKVRLREGPFVDFIGVIDDINIEKGKVGVLVSFFGRETPIEVDLVQVERL